jgi:serine/threonine protein kinase
VKYE